MDTDELVHRFRYHAPDEGTRQLHQRVRDRLEQIALSFNIVLPEGREKSLVITKLEEAMFWANAAIARDCEAE